MEQVPMWIMTGVVMLANLYMTVSARLHNRGKEDGISAADVRYIKETLGRMDGQFTGEIRRVEGRVDQIAMTQTTQGEKLVKAEESTKSAHRRIDDLTKKGEKYHEQTQYHSKA